MEKNTCMTNMGYSLFFNKYLILFLSFFSHMIISFGGEMSVSFLFITITTPFWFKWKYLDRDRTLAKTVKLIGVLIGIQCLWAVFHSYTDAFTQLKGIMVTAYGLIQFLFYYLAASYNQGIIKWYVLGSFISSFFFFDMIALREAEIVEEYTLWKFQIYPRIIMAMLSIYLFFWKNEIIKRYIEILFIAVGLLGLATGSRSAGLPPLIAGTIVLLVKNSKSLDLSMVRSRLVIGAIVLYALYALIYVPNVLNGSISGGNSEQLREAKDPYNPLYLLMIGRSDAIIPFVAFFDKPFWGWGYNTKDPDNKYHRINASFKQNKFNIEHVTNNNIPGHSIWGYYSCSYGVLAFIVFILLIRIIIKKYSLFLKHPDETTLYASYLLFALFWSMLFSPMPTFKLTWTVNLAFYLALSNYSIIRYGKV